jgi:streptogramin lyase
MIRTETDSWIHLQAAYDLAVSRPASTPDPKSTGLLAWTEHPVRERSAGARSLVQEITVANVSRRALSLSLALVVASEAHAQVTQFPVPTPNSRPYTIVAGPDGNLWFTESNGNKLARITPDGVITEFPVPTANSGPYGLTVGRDGQIWFTERFANKIGRFSPLTLTFQEFTIPTPFAQPWEIALGADGKLWFTEEDVNQIGRITPQGVIREFVPPTCCFPTGITAGSDGNMWFTLEIGEQIGRVQPQGGMTMFTIPTVQCLPWDITPALGGGLWFSELAGRAIGRITTNGQIVEHPIAGPFSGIAGVGVGPDGNVWFTENDTDHVGAMDPSGAVVQLLDTDTGARPLCITLGPDGNMWFTQADTNAIGRVDRAAPDEVHVLSLDAAFSPRVRKARLGQRLQWTFLGPNAHSVVDDSGLGLLDSGLHGFVTYYRTSCFAAGTLIYRDGAGIAPKAAITVPVSLPASASVGVPFSVVWALGPPPAGLVYDVQLRAPGSGFVDWSTGTTPRALYTPLVAGRHFFQARVRDPLSGNATLYSIPSSVLVH